MAKPTTKPLNEVIVQYHRTRVEFLEGASRLRAAIDVLVETRSYLNQRRVLLLELSQEIGPRLHADVSGIIGGAKVDNDALDGMLHEARKQLGQLTELEGQVVAARTRADAAQ